MKVGLTMLRPIKTPEYCNELKEQGRQLPPPFRLYLLSFQKTSGTSNEEARLLQPSACVDRAAEEGLHILPG